MSKKLFCFGLGYSALFLCDKLMQEGWQIAGTTTSEEKRKALEIMGVDAFIFDGTYQTKEILPALKTSSHILSSVPPNADGDVVLNYYSQDLKDLAPHWVGYFSSTGVYGDHNGAWVDETSECVPTGERGHRRLKAEKQWLEFHKKYNLPVHIFRLSGIYGPGRNVLTRIKNGTAQRIDKPGHYFSRIHVEDITSVLEASFQNPTPGEIYNLADDIPCPSLDVTDFGYDLLNIEKSALIPFEKAALSPGMLSFYNDNKRVKNDKIKTTFKITLNYPSYREGLKNYMTNVQAATQ